MPELPDVEGFRRVAAEHVIGRRVTSVRVHDASVVQGVSARRFRELLRGRHVGQPRRHGKWLLLPTSGSAAGEGDGLPCLMVHFGMTGMLLWCSVDADPHQHDRVVLVFTDGELRYRDMRKLKGMVLARSEVDVEAVLGELGPDAGQVSRADLRDRLTRTRRQLKSALMDQSRIAGLGNLTVDETLWRARLHPQRTTKELDESQWKSLYRAMRFVLRESSAAGLVPDRPSWLTGHRDDADGRCPRCSTTLRHQQIGGRTTVWCPHCQSRPQG